MRLYEEIYKLADHVLAAWRGYMDESAFVFVETDGELHNTITSIARKKDIKDKETPLLHFLRQRSLSYVRNLMMILQPVAD